MFGTVFGAFYSLVGMMLASIYFYYGSRRMPRMFRKIWTLKEKWLGKEVSLTLGQLAILRLLPFMHFHFISFCLMEATENVREYTRASFFTNLPLAVVYTAFGNWIHHLGMRWSAAMILGLALLFYVLRKKEWVLSWDEFFQTETKTEA